MAKADVKIVQSPYDNHPTRSFIREDRTTSSDTVCYAGEPVKLGSANDVIHLATGDPEIGTDLMVGITAGGSTETSTADGVVDVYLALPGVVYRCAATTPANLAQGILLDSVTFDLTGTTYTVDENEGTDPNVHGLIIMDYDATAGTVDFMINSYATLFGGVV